MKFVVDRIENEILVVVNESGEAFNLPRNFLKEVDEGDSFEITVTDDKNKKEQLRERLGNLFERGKKND